MKFKILSLILSSILIISIPHIDLNNKTKKEINCAEKVNLRIVKIEQVEGFMKAEYEKFKEIEEERIRKEEEIKRLEELNRKIVFNPYDVSEVSNLTLEEWELALGETALVTLASAFKWYEEVYKVNGLFIASIVALESSWGRSSLAISHNNLTGYIGQDGNYYYFNSWGQSLEETFRLISEEYISEEGLFYDGKSIWDINKKYCELGSWADKVSTIAYQLKGKVEVDK